MLNKLPPDALEDWDERSGILQYDAGFSRELSEAYALLLIASKYKILM